MQRGLPAEAPRGHTGAPAQEEADRVGLYGTRRLVQRRPVAERPLVDVTTMFEEGPQHVDPPVARSKVDGREAVPVVFQRIRAGIEQTVNGIRIPIDRSRVECRKRFGRGRWAGAALLSKGHDTEQADNGPANAGDACHPLLHVSHHLGA